MRDERSSPSVNPTVEASVLRLLTEPLQGGHRDAGDAREQGLTQFFMGLDAIDALQLERRLQINASTDPVVVAFRRLVIERRERLTAVLGQRRKMLQALRQKR